MAIPGRRPNVTTPVLPGHHPERDPSAAGGYITELETPEALTPEAAVIWETIVPELVKGKVLREDDLVMLMEACEAWAIAIWFRRHLQRQQKIYDEFLNEDPPRDPDEREKWEKRGERASAEVKRLRSGWNAAYKMALAASGDLGLGPVARVRLGLAKVQGASLLDALSENVSVQKDGS